MNTENRHNTYIDLVRIIMTLSVLFTHVGQHSGIDFDGSCAVQGFFILSGYLACKSLEKRKSICDYYKSRIISIVPSYYVCLTLTFIIYIFLGILLNNEYLQLLDLKYVRYFLFLQQFIPSNNYWLWNNLGALWTMSSFFLLYLVAPLFKKICDNVSKTVLFVVLFFLFNKFIFARIDRIALLLPNVSEPTYFIRCFPLISIYYFLLGYLIYFIERKKDYYFYGFIFMQLLLLIYKAEYNYMVYLLLISISVLLHKKNINLITNVNVTKFIINFSNLTFAVYLFHPQVLLISDIAYNYIYFYRVLMQTHIWLYEILLLFLSIAYAYLINKKVILKVNSLFF